MEMFFVISGFVIPYSMWRGGYQVRHFGRFLIKRLMRLEPPYLASIVITIAVALLGATHPAFHGSKPSYPTFNLLLHLGYLCDLFGRPWVNPVYWTLAIEFQFYLFTALIFPLLASRSATVRWAFLIAITAASFLPSPKTEFHAITLIYYLGLFALGMLAFHYHTRMIGLNGFIFGVAAMTIAVGLRMDWIRVTAATITALIIAFVPLPRRGAGWLVFLGGMSYSIYLMHIPFGTRIINFGARHTNGTASEIVLLAVALSSTIFVAWALSRLVEIPARRLAGRVKYQPQAVSATMHTWRCRLRRALFARLTAAKTGQTLLF